VIPRHATRRSCVDKYRSEVVDEIGLHQASSLSGNLKCPHEFFCEISFINLLKVICAVNNMYWENSVSVETDP
jgi:hypothetical protein